MTQPALIYEFGDFSVDAAKRQLRGRGGLTVPLTTRAFETLLYLVGRSGTVLEKDELLRAIWPDAIVEENNLTQAISSLRARPRRKPRGAPLHYDRAGSRLLFCRRRENAPASFGNPNYADVKNHGGAAVSAFSSGIPRPCVGVGHGGHADRQTRRQGNYRAPRDLSPEVRGIGSGPLAAGRELGVELVLGGSIQRREDSIRVTVRLVNTADGTSLDRNF